MDADASMNRRSRRRLAALGLLVGASILLAAWTLWSRGAPRIDAPGDDVTPTPTRVAARPSDAALDADPVARGKARREGPPSAVPAPPALVPAPRVRLRLVEADGTPVRGGYARLEGSSRMLDAEDPQCAEEESPNLRFEYTEAGPVGPDGRVAFDVPQERQGLEMSVRLRRPGIAVMHGTVDLTTVTEQTVRMEPFGEAGLRGLVTREDGSPVPDLALRIARGHVGAELGRDEVAGRYRVANEGPETPFGRVGEHEVADVRSDTEGRFRVEGLAPDTYHVVDVGPGWMLQVPGNLYPGSVEASVVVTPAYSAVVHVRSAADGAPVPPSRVFVETHGQGGGSKPGPYAADLSIRWPVSRTLRGAGATLTIEAGGHFPARVGVRAGPAEPTTHTTVSLRPLPPGPPGSLHLALATSDRAFLDAPFQAEFHVPRPAPGSASQDTDPDLSDLVVQRIEGRREGDRIVFDGVVPGTWRVRAWTRAAERRLAWEAEVSVPSGAAAAATWVVPPHGAVVLGPAWPEGYRMWISEPDGEDGESRSFSTSGAGRVFLPVGAWSIAWRASEESHEVEEITVEIEDGRDRVIPAPLSPGAPR